MSERFEWARKVMQVRPGDHILEVGCGPGTLAYLLAEDLRDGVLTAIDKSPSAITSASKKNRQWIEAGRVEVRREQFPCALEQSFHKVVAFNVSSFWSDKGECLCVAQSVLKRNGKVFLFYQPPFEKTRQIAEQAIAFIGRHGGKVEKVLYEEMEPASVFCIQLKV